MQIWCQVLHQNATMWPWWNQGNFRAKPKLFKRLQVQTLLVHFSLFSISISNFKYVECPRNMPRRATVLIHKSFWSRLWRRGMIWLYSMEAWVWCFLTSFIDHLQLVYVSGLCLQLFCVTQDAMLGACMLLLSMSGLLPRSEAAFNWSFCRIIGKDAGGQLGTSN